MTSNETVQHIISQLNDEQSSIFYNIIEEIKANKNEGCFGNNIIIITGQAGTGKSFLSSCLVKYLEHYPVSRYPLKCTALTHKAATEFGKKLDSNLSTLKAGTIHSYLNIKAVIDYKTGREVFEVQRGKAIQKSSVLFIDEVSMIDEELFNIIRKHSEFYETVIMIGDEYQIPSVNSSAFNLFTYPGIKIFKLENIVRQAENNPIIKLSSAIVEKIKAKDFIDIDFCKNMIHEYSSKCTEIKHLNIEAFISNYRDYVKDDIGKPLKGSKFTDALITTFTNDRVNKYNYIAKKVYKNVQEPEYIDIGDILVLQDPAFNPYTGDVELPCNAEFEVDFLELEPHKGIESYVLRSKEYPGFYLRVIDENNFEAISRFNKELEVIKAQAMASDGKNRGILWKKFYEFKHAFCSVKQIYACTTHKSQGTTVKKVYVDLNNMPWDRNPELAFRLCYVACTRSTDEVICTF